jgi:hypothetical protein
VSRGDGSFVIAVFLRVLHLVMITDEAISSYGLSVSVYMTEFACFLVATLLPIK